MFKLTGQKFRKKEVNKKKYFHNLALTFSELQKGGIAMRKLLLLALAVFALTVVLLLTFAVPAMARPPNTAMTAMAANSQTSLDLSVVVSRGISVPKTMATARNGPRILTPTAMAANDPSSELLSLIAEAQTQEALNANRLNYGGLIGLPGALGYTSTFTLTDSPMIQRRSIGSLPVCVPVAYLNGLGQRQAQSAAYYNSMHICMAATARGNTTHTITGKSTVLRL